VPATRPEGAERYVPERRSLGRMREAVQACRGCELWRDATQAVFGEGPAHADLVLRSRSQHRRHIEHERGQHLYRERNRERRPDPCHSTEVVRRST